MVFEWSARIRNCTARSSDMVGAVNTKDQTVVKSKYYTGPCDPIDHAIPLNVQYTLFSYVIDITGFHRLN